MSWLVLGALMIVYPLFGLGIYIIRNRLAKTQNFSMVVLAPAVISFVLGILFMMYALIFN